MNKTDRLPSAAPLIGALLLILVMSAAAADAIAQPLVNARTSALGGGGTAWVTGFDAAFINPANLFIADRSGSVHVGLGSVAHFAEPVYSSAGPADYLRYQRSGFLPYRSGDHTIDHEQRQSILEEQYGTRRTLAENRFRSDLTVAGALWQKPESAFSLSLRFRQGVRTETGKGWYTGQFQGPVRDMTLRKQKQNLMELSAGFAREFTFINGLSPGMGVLLVGIAPKLVAGGGMADLHYRARYTSDEEGAGSSFTHSFRGRTSGSFTGMVSRYRLEGDAQAAVNRELDPLSGFSPEGYGAGFDIGLTWFLPLGSITVSAPGEAPSAERSLRFAFSVTDLGLVRYHGSPLTLSTPRVTGMQGAETPSSIAFTGADGQYLVMMENLTALSNPILAAGSSDREPFSVPLPTSLNAGVLLDLDRMKVMGDVTFGLSETAFNTVRPAGHFGMELRPLPFLPIRAGTQLSPGEPMILGMGAGIETGSWDLQIAARVLSRSSSPGTDFSGGALAGLLFHF